MEELVDVDEEIDEDVVNGVEEAVPVALEATLGALQVEGA
jgi:hypothetical protein